VSLVSENAGGNETKYRKTLLVTGFLPFPGMPVNPTAALVSRLPSLMPDPGHPVRLECHLLPTTWAARDSVTAPLIDELKPAAVVHFGVAGKRRVLSIETRAVNQATRLIPDAAGQHHPTGTLAFGPSERPSTLPVRRLREAVSRTGAPVELSRDCGTYLCNATLWDTLGTGVPAVFVHVPPTTRTPGDRRLATPILEAAAVSLLQEVRRMIA